ncbi:DNA polymerase III subunit beta [Paenibacillus sp. PL91]|uniref:DNA polymerase III subunit beta n=1 Tax=Paenibacillus sp. PL91 TaxID=2729538 RepID=UPI00145D84C0|nr:DNA polymerase III subunit beta [Paenibacillus sp. PL91]MBC9199487.1 DNA polymerase III subunit beta [Paenibacillus sp. PL91]
MVETRQQSLHIGLQHIAAAISVKAVSPILTGVKVHAGSGALTLTASNASLSLQYVVPCHPDHLRIHQEGSTVIPARFFIDIIRSFSTDSIVTLKQIENQFIRIESDNSVYRLAAMDASQFPDMHHVASSAGFSIESVDFKKMVKQVTFAASTNDSKLILTGISCQADLGKLKLVATDGIRLAVRAADLGSDRSSLAPAVIVPAKHLSDYSKMLSDRSSATQITVADHIICFSSQNFTMQSLLIQGSFPSIERLVPKPCSTELTLDAAAFLHAVQRVTLIAQHTPVIGLQISSAEIELFANAAEVGDVSAKLEVQAFSGEPLTVFFNGKFMRDILQAIDSEQVYLQLTGKHKPIIIKPTNSQDALYIITPVRTAHQP